MDVVQVLDCQSAGGTRSGGPRGETSTAYSLQVTTVWVSPFVRSKEGAWAPPELLESQGLHAIVPLLLVTGFRDRSSGSDDSWVSGIWREIKSNGSSEQVSVPPTTAHGMVCGTLSLVGSSSSTWTHLLPWF